MQNTYSMYTTCIDFRNFFWSSLSATRMAIFYTLKKFVCIRSMFKVYMNIYTFIYNNIYMIFCLFDNMTMTQ
jgi:hypothetical protein